MAHVTTAELEAALEHLKAAPTDGGTVELIVRRPSIDEREILEEATLDTEVGLVGDNWSMKPSSSSPDGGPHPDAQLTLMNARCAALLAGDGAGRHERMAQAGDQLYVDFDIGHDNLPAGTRLSIGDAVVEITAKPHTGCAKFSSRFGLDALRFVNGPEGSPLRLRGANAKVVTGGTVRRGSAVKKLA